MMRVRGDGIYELEGFVTTIVNRECCSALKGRSRNYSGINFLSHCKYVDPEVRSIVRVRMTDWNVKVSATPAGPISFVHCVVQCLHVYSLRS